MKEQSKGIDQEGGAISLPVGKREGGRSRYARKGFLCNYVTPMSIEPGTSVIQIKDPPL